MHQGNVHHYDNRAPGAPVYGQTFVETRLSNSQLMTSKSLERSVEELHTIVNSLQHEVHEERAARNAQQCDIAKLQSKVRKLQHSTLQAECQEKLMTEQIHSMSNKLDRVNTDMNYWSKSMDAMNVSIKKLTGKIKSWGKYLQEANYGASKKEPLNPNQEMLKDATGRYETKKQGHCQTPGKATGIQLGDITVPSGPGTVNTETLMNRQDTVTQSTPVNLGLTTEKEGLSTDIQVQPGSMTEDSLVVQDMRHFGENVVQLLKTTTAKPRSLWLEQILNM
ncbi:MAG: hypothetical protein GY702_12695, partial [Desulfobulbaceae bacterium]|nr:hypothetical protein [Desulfobulbaceae bacterium]